MRLADGGDFLGMGTGGVLPGWSAPPTAMSPPLVFGTSGALLDSREEFLF